MRTGPRAWNNMKSDYAYFEELLNRAALISHKEWKNAQRSCCHANCESYIKNFGGYEIVRGWLIIGEHFFIPHSVVRNSASGELIDITPKEESEIPFAEHLGTEDDFQLFRKGRDGGYLHPPITEIPPGSEHDDI